MGKKEKEIALKNAEYYKEINHSIQNEYLAYEKEQEEIAYNTSLLDEANDLMENTVNEIKKQLSTYAYEIGLPLCENLDLVNLENYISFVLVGCPVARRKPNKTELPKEFTSDEEKKPLMSQDEYESLCSEVKELTSDCERIRNIIFKSLGEDELSRSYSEFFKGTTMTAYKQKELVKRVGQKEYDKVVTNLGQIEYEKRFG